MSKVWNFSAGPAVLPAPVMAKAQAEFCDFHGIGYGIMEASHRGADFMEVIAQAEADLRALLGISDDYSVLFLQGGASSQFAMLPLNLLAKGGVADYADTGAWSKKAIAEVAPHGSANVVASSKDANYSYIPAFDSWQRSEDAVYTHVTSNNTIFGTQYQSFPEADVLVADMSSDILSRPLDVSKFGVIYAGAQKNLGPSGVTLVIIRKDLTERVSEDLPTMLKYKTHIASGSMFNTPPTFSIYMVGLVTAWLRELGGLTAIEAQNAAKGDALYGCIDADDFYACPTALDSRSVMNVCFTIANSALEADFISEAGSAGLVGLKGHRSVGGMRASIYNAMPQTGVDALVSFMVGFRARRG
jgi:phosphoserine aminotransferase